jgi:hypothetical protein
MLAVSLWRDDDFGAAIDDPAGEMVGVVSLVGDCCFGFDAVDQVVGEGDVVALSGRSDQADRKPERLGGGVDLGA